MSTPPSTQSALVINAQGERVVREQRPVPTPGPHEVLIKVTSAGLNPHDQKVRDRGILGAPFPWIAANDVAGVVEVLGDGVTKYQKGDHVFAQSSLQPDRPSEYNGLQEYALVDVRISAKTPANLSDDDANTMPTNAVAVFWAFFDRQGGFGLPTALLDGVTDSTFDPAQHDLVILGGGSQIGKLAVQLAKLLGWRRIVVTASLANERDLRAMGATHVVDRHGEFDEVVRRVRAVVGDDLRHSLNAIGGDRTLGIAVLSDAVEGHSVHLTSGTADTARVGPKRAGFRDTGIFGASATNQELGDLFWDRYLPRWLADGSFQVPRWRVLPGGLDADGVNAVFDRYRDGQAVVEHVHVHPHEN